MAVRLADADDLSGSRRAGRAVDEVLRLAREAALPGVTPSQLDVGATTFAASLGLVPSGRIADPVAGWAAGSVAGPMGVLQVCRCSEGLLQRPPDAEDGRPLRAGELIVLDVFGRLGLRCADAAITHAVPGGRASEADRLLRAAARAALAGLLACLRPGVSWGICLRAAEAGAARHGARLAAHAAGHGVGAELHEPPALPSDPGRQAAGQVLFPGMVLAVEPAVVLGSPEIVHGSDGRAATADGGPIAFEERTLAVTTAGVRLLAGRVGRGLGVTGGGPRPDGSQQGHCA